MAPTALKWTGVITVQDLWSHTASWIWVAWQQYWRNQAATVWTPANTSFEGHDFCVSVFYPGRAETLVRPGGKTNPHSRAYSLSNVSAKNYQNRFMCVEVIVCNISVVFWDTVYTRVIVTVVVLAIVAVLSSLSYLHRRSIWASRNSHRGWRLKKWRPVFVAPKLLPTVLLTL